MTTYDGQGEAAGRIYPCAKCGKMRTKSEGGTTFTVCEDCWDDAPKGEAAGRTGYRTPEELVEKMLGRYAADCLKQAYAEEIAAWGVLLFEELKERVARPANDFPWEIARMQNELRKGE